MNSKRQTIWLVSMLSLMVVLSAYYLFTEDVNKLEVASTGVKTNEIVVNTGQLDVKQPDAAHTQTGTAPASDKNADSAKSESNKSSEPKASSTKTDTPSSTTPSTTKADDKAAQPVSKSETKASTEDAQILQKMQAAATSGTDYFLSAQMKRNEELTKKIESLMTVITDPKQTAEAAAKAQEEYNKIQDMEAKVTNLEDTLGKEFPQVVVTQEANKWKITVQSKKLERSQAVSIVDKAIQELGVQADQVSVVMKP